MATAAFWQAVHGDAALPETPAVAYQVPERQGDLIVVDEAFVEAAHRCGQAVHVWTVNEAEAMERLLSLGVDGIISDVPSTLVRVLESSADSVIWDGHTAR